MADLKEICSRIGFPLLLLWRPKTECVSIWTFSLCPVPTIIADPPSLHPPSLTCMIYILVPSILRQRFKAPCKAHQNACVHTHISHTFASKSSGVLIFLECAGGLLIYAKFSVL